MEGAGFQTQVVVVPYKVTMKKERWLTMVCAANTNHFQYTNFNLTNTSL
jgi:hypothetical protein